jgi:hypothetical protein
MQKAGHLMINYGGENIDDYQNFMQIKPTELYSEVYKPNGLYASQEKPD